MPIGLDLGTSCVRMIQFAAAGDGLKVSAAGRYDLSTDVEVNSPQRWAELVTAIRKLTASAPFTGRQVVVSLPESMVSYKNVRLPQMPPDEMAKAVEFEAAERFGAEASSLMLQHLVAGQVNVGEQVRSEVIAMAVTNPALEQVMGVLAECDLDPVAIDVAPTSLARSLARSHQAEQVRVLVDVGYSSSKVLILCGNIIRFYKDLDIAGRQINQALADHLKISPSDAAELRRRHMLGKLSDDDADSKLFGSSRRQDVEQALTSATRGVLEDLAREIGLCQRYHSVTFRGARSAELTLSGGEAYDPLIASTIAEKLELQVDLADPLAGVNIDGHEVLTERPGTLPDWAAVTGLALRLAPATQIRGAA
ncbi:pilus assembly protein PilM [Planctomycetales bacterium ZRK34]|nr:pilus assembly protein PilM [Planctomycetales bacterium ZRK34]